jgi:hypothetical protein
MRDRLERITKKPRIHFFFRVNTLSFDSQSSGLKVALFFFVSALLFSPYLVSLIPFFPPTRSHSRITLLYQEGFLFFLFFVFKRT